MIQLLLKDTVVYIGDKYIILDTLDKYTNREDFITFISELVYL